MPGRACEIAAPLDLLEVTVELAAAAQSARESERRR